MLRSYGVSLGSLAMGLVALRGAMLGELAGSVAKEAMVALVVFGGIGVTVGWIADHLVRDALKRMFHNRLEWYRNGLIEAGYDKPDSSRNR